MSDYEIIYNLPHKKPAEDTCKQTKSKPEFFKLNFIIISNVSNRLNSFQKTFRILI